MPFLHMGMPQKGKSCCDYDRSAARKLCMLDREGENRPIMSTCSACQ